MNNKWFILVASLFVFGSVYVQDKIQAEKLINEGVTLEDNGKSDQALLKYQQALDADYDSAMQNQAPVQKFKRKFDVLCETLKGTRSNNTGFYWDFYATYFIDMKDKDLTETFSYIAFASTNTPEVTEWLLQHKSETEAFFKWSAEFKWK